MWRSERPIPLIGSPSQPNRSDTNTSHAHSQSQIGPRKKAQIPEYSTSVAPGTGLSDEGPKATHSETPIAALRAAGPEARGAARRSSCACAERGLRRGDSARRASPAEKQERPGQADGQRRRRLGHNVDVPIEHGERGRVIPRRRGTVHRREQHMARRPRGKARVNLLAGVGCPVSVQDDALGVAGAELELRRDVRVGDVQAIQAGVRIRRGRLIAANDSRTAPGSKSPIGVLRCGQTHQRHVPSGRRRRANVLTCRPAKSPSLALRGRVSGRSVELKHDRQVGQVDHPVAVEVRV